MLIKVVQFQELTPTVCKSIVLDNLAGTQYFLYLFKILLISLGIPVIFGSIQLLNEYFDRRKFLLIVDKLTKNI